MMLKTKLNAPLDYAVYVYDVRLYLVDYKCVFITLKIRSILRVN